VFVSRSVATSVGRSERMLAKAWAGVYTSRTNSLGDPACNRCTKFCSDLFNAETPQNTKGLANPSTFRGVAFRRSRSRLKHLNETFSVTSGTAPAKTRFTANEPRSRSTRQQPLHNKTPPRRSARLRTARSGKALENTADYNSAITHLKIAANSFNLISSIYHESAAKWREKLWVTTYFAAAASPEQHRSSRNDALKKLTATGPPRLGVQQLVPRAQRVDLEVKPVTQTRRPSAADVVFDG